MMNYTIELPHLFSTQEESDTCIFLYASDACSRQKVTRVVLWSVNTDVMIIGIYMSN